MKKIFLTLLFILIVPCVSVSAPDIQNDSGGPLVHKASFTIGGLAFGAKSPAAPYFYDNFEGGTPTNTIYGESGTVGTPVWEQTTDESTPSEYSNTQYYGTNAGQAGRKFADGNNFEVGYIDGINSTTVFFSCKWRWTCSGTNWTGGTQVLKPFRLTASGGYYTTTPRYRTQSQPFFTNFYDNYEACNGCGSEETDYGTYPAQDTWHSFDLEYVLGTVDTANGRIQSWHDAILNLSDLAATTLRTGYDAANIDSALAPGDMANDAAQNYTHYFDNFYFDNTLARIELGNNAVYANCTQREIQIPSAWTATTASFTVNQGDFADEATAYLFLIDAAGDASPGYGVTIGGAAPSGDSTTMNATGPVSSFNATGPVTTFSP